MPRLDYAKCPHCGKEANGTHQVERYFGLRTMRNGTVRVQSWCISCRSK